jgi:hypothetical protein
MTWRALHARSYAEVEATLRAQLAEAEATRLADGDAAAADIAAVRASLVRRCRLTLSTPR